MSNVPGGYYVQDTYSGDFHDKRVKGQCLRIALDEAGECGIGNNVIAALQDWQSEDRIVVFGAVLVR